MNFIEMRSDFECIINVIIKPHSNKQTITKPSNNDEQIHISIRSEAKQNKANIELINLIKKKLKVSIDQLQIISGRKNPNKRIKVTFSKNHQKEEILNKLLA
ncbi:MAG: DUF167 domain-containing protein [Candidatus Lokiarchaeota archaeon]|nr:DUF167 domain-containing protein [Candidatus Lokiarchaeota archaeon]